jgi:hypothetical protein
MEELCHEAVAVCNISVPVLVFPFIGGAAASQATSQLHLMELGKDDTLSEEDVIHVQTVACKPQHSQV